MDINAITVKKYRNQFGWTQQLLADSCDVSLRTIQRVERYGSASTETLMSLCAVFEIDKQKLIVVDDSQANSNNTSQSRMNSALLLTISVSVGTILGAVVMYLIMR